MMENDDIAIIDNVTMIIITDIEAHGSKTDITTHYTIDRPVIRFSK